MRVGERNGPVRVVRLAICFLQGPRQRDMAESPGKLQMGIARDDLRRTGLAAQAHAEGHVVFELICDSHQEDVSGLGGYRVPILRQLLDGRRFPPQTVISRNQPLYSRAGAVADDLSVCFGRCADLVGEIAILVNGMQQARGDGFWGRAGGCQDARGTDEMGDKWLAGSAKEIG